MAIERNDNTLYLAPKIGDARYGPWLTTGQAISYLPWWVRKEGLTVGIRQYGMPTDGIVEYWFRDGVSDEDLIRKDQSHHVYIQEFSPDVNVIGAIWIKSDTGERYYLYKMREANQVWVQASSWSNLLDFAGTPIVQQSIAVLFPEDEIFDEYNWDEDDLNTTHNSSPTVDMDSPSFVSMELFIPNLSDVTINVEYSMTADNGGRMSHQRSYIKCVSPGGMSEAIMSSGTGITEGTYFYERDITSLIGTAQKGGFLTFELHIWRTFNFATTILYNVLDGGSLKYTVEYTLDIGNAKAKLVGVYTTGVGFKNTYELLDVDNSNQIIETSEISRFLLENYGRYRIKATNEYGQTLLGTILKIAEHITADIITTPSDPLIEKVEVIYGSLYNAYTAINPDIAAPGWYVPSAAQFNELGALAISQNPNGTAADYLRNKRHTRTFNPLVGLLVPSILAYTPYWTFLSNDIMGEMSDPFNLSIHASGSSSGNTNAWINLSQWAGIWTSDFGTRAMISRTSNNLDVAFTDMYYRLYNIRLVRDLLPGEELLPNGTFVDNYIGNDGFSYKAVKVGNLVWTAESLIETIDRHGNPIPFISNVSDQQNAIYFGALGAMSHYAHNQNYSHAFRHSGSIFITNVESGYSDIQTNYQFNIGTGWNSARYFDNLPSGEYTIRARTSTDTITSEIILDVVNI